jgi:hypothetical protein
MMKVRDLRRAEFLLNGNRKYIFFALLLFTFHFSLFTVCATAQNEEPKDSEPPPLRMISKEEKTQLEAQNEIKARTNLALLLMETRLKKAEDFYNQQAYTEMFTELGGFHALIDNTLNFLNRNNNESRKVLNTFKKLEMSLRNYVSRLELIRREVPSRYEFYVRNLVKTVRDARTRAIEPLFSDSVVPVEDLTPNAKKDN